MSREEHESVRQGLMRELAKLKATLASHKETAVQRENVSRFVDCGGPTGLSAQLR